MSNSHDSEEQLFAYPEKSLDDSTDYSVVGMEDAHELGHPPRSKRVGSIATKQELSPETERLEAMGIYNADEIRKRVDPENSYEANAWIHGWVPASTKEFNPAQRDFDPLRALKAKLPPSVKRSIYRQMQGFRASALRAKNVLTNEESTEEQHIAAIVDYLYGKKLVEYVRENSGHTTGFGSIEAQVRAEAEQEAKTAHQALTDAALRNHEQRFNYWHASIQEAERHLPFLTKPE